MMAGGLAGADSVGRKVKELSKKKTEKAKPVFGQLTLTGEKALDWLKDGTEAHIVKIEIGPIGAFQEYNIPDWAGEKTGDIAILHQANRFANPILVTQRSVLRHLEVICVDKESEGAVARVEKAFACQKAVLELPEDDLKLKFVRDSEKGKFAPYDIITL